MPAAIPAITTAVANALFFTSLTAGQIALIAGAASFVAGAAVSIGASFALGALSRAIAGKPDLNGIDAVSGRNQTVKQAITAHRIIYGEVRVGGTVTFLTTTINDGLFHMVTTLAGHEIDSVQNYYFNDEELTLDAKGKPTSGTWNPSGVNPRARVIAGLGTTAGDTAFNAALIANAGGLWTSNHRQSGRAKAYVEGAVNNFPNGIPNATFVVRGKKILDTRTSTTAYSNNAALCIYDYLTDTSVGLGEPTTRINTASFNAAANICDEAVNLNPSGTEARYTINGTIDTSEEPKSILQKMLSACAGILTYQGGQWSLYVGAYRAPTITIDEDWLDGAIRVQTKIGRKEIFNRVKGIYVSPDDLYQPTDFPPVTNATYLTEDNSEEIWKDIELPFTTSSAAAQRLAKIELERARQQITVSMPLNLKGFRFQVGDVVNIDNTRMGWSGKPFEVREWQLSLRGGGDSPRLGVDVVLRETASTVFDWALGEETTVDPAPNTNLPDPFTVGSPGVPSITETLFSAKDGGGVKARATISWAAANDTFVTKYLVEYKLTTDADWIPVPTTAKLTLNIDDIAPGLYDFRVTAISKFEFQSTPASTTSEIFGLSAPPSDITGLTISPISGLAVLSWNPVTDLDVREGGKIVFRHSSALTGATWGASVTIGQSVPGTASSVTLPLVEGTYLVKAKDSSGVYSTGVASISTKSPSLFTFSNLSTLTLDPDFDATHSGTVSVDSVLRLDGATTIDSWGTIDSIADWDYEGGVVSTGTATFTTGIDLGSVKTVRLKASVTTLTANISDTIDSRTSNIDTWENIDGSSGGQTDFQLFVRETDDDPAGTPTWSDWKVLALAEYNARGFQFKSELSTDDPTYNISVTALEILADQVV